MQVEPTKAEPPKRKRRWFQFSLRSLMVFNLICALRPVGWARRWSENATSER